MDAIASDMECSSSIFLRRKSSDVADNLTDDCPFQRRAIEAIGPGRRASLRGRILAICRAGKILRIRFAPPKPSGILGKSIEKVGSLMLTPTITVMMPCFNNSAYIEAVEASVLRQTYLDIELVIVDDASSDDSVSIIERFTDSRIRLHCNPRNQGVAAVRNQLLERAAGTFLSSLNGDDLYQCSEKLASEINRMPRVEGCRPTIVYGDVELIDAAGRVLSRVSGKSPDLEGILFKAILDRSVMIPRDFLVSAKLAKSIGGFDERLALYEDWDYKLRLAQQAKFVFTNRIGIGYRRHRAGLSVAKNKLHGRYRDDVLKKYCNGGHASVSMVMMLQQIKM